jgi:hypothetical protein
MEPFILDTGAFRGRVPTQVQAGAQLSSPVRTSDGKTRDSTGAFMVGELERLDQTLHMPLAAVTWHRDIDLREDVTIADEISSFTLMNGGVAGGLGQGSSPGNGKSWAGKNTTQIVQGSLDISKTTHPLRVWAQELGFTVLELESAAKIGRPVDQQKFEFLQLKHQMDIDEMVYYGDTGTGDTGLLNNSLITNTAAVAAGASTHTLWSTKTPQEILADVNSLITSVWTASAYAVMPNRILLPPLQFGYISTTNVSTAGNVSILRYLEENNITVRANRGGGIQFFPCKWLVGLASGGTLGVPANPSTNVSYDVMFCYTKDKQRVRYPMTMMQRTPIQFQGLYHLTTYFCRLGVVEVVYPETAGWRYGI